MDERPADHIKKSGRLVIAIYAHIEAYPPSLNALYHLAPLFDEVYILVRNVMVSRWEYPDNVHIVTSGKYIPPSEVPKLSVFEKAWGYLTFGQTLNRLVKERSPEMVILYDMIAFSLFNIFSSLLVRTKKIPIWYHNHDVAIESEVGKFSLMRLLKKFELRYFNRASYFSLPNEVRIRYFPVDRLKRAAVVLPNYPSKFFFGKWQASVPNRESLKLIFQGHMGKANNLERIIQVLGKRVDNKLLELHLAGPIDVSYKSVLLRLAEERGVSSQLFFYGRIPYADLPRLTASCHIGLALYGSHNTMVRTMSTASNKIFEYASVGLPVIISRREDMEAEFSSYPWIKFSDLDEAALIKTLTDISTRFSYFSDMAKADFRKELNFEKSISPFLEVLKEDFKRTG